MNSVIIKVWMNRPWHDIVCVEMVNIHTVILRRAGFREGGDPDVSFNVREGFAANVMFSTLTEGLPEQYPHCPNCNRQDGYSNSNCPNCGAIVTNNIE